MEAMEVLEPDEWAVLETDVHKRSKASAVIGIDVGGTSTRAIILTRDGLVAALATGPGANLRSSPDTAAATLTDVLTTAKDYALATLGYAVDVAACVAGVAGGGPAAQGQVHEMLAGALTQAGLSPTVLDLVPDPLVAFAAGSPAPDGVVLLAGTGAAAFGVAGFDQTNRADGLGWLLGDVGGGIWLALEGFRAAAADLDGRGPMTVLTGRALKAAAELGATTGDPRQDLIRLVHGSSPSELGAFAPSVTGAADEQDEVALQIIDRAIQGLLLTYAAVGSSHSGAIVLAGSVLTQPGLIRDGVLAGLDRPTYDAVQPVVGALRLAAHRADWPLPELDELTAAVHAAPSRAIAPASRKPTLKVDGYRPADRDVQKQICMRTGDSGADASAMYRDTDLLGHVYLGAYLKFEPELVRVLRRADGVPVGYCVATRDTREFERRSEKEWWPTLRNRYAMPAADDDSADARMIRLIHASRRTEGDWLADFPAHLHVDLLPEAQGGGNGKRVLEAVLQAVSASGVPGVHLGVGGANVRAIGFYEHSGFRTLVHRTWGLTMGRVLAAQ